MPEQLDALERELIALGQDLSPEAPREGIADAVLARLAADEATPERRHERAWRPRRLAWAVTAMVVAVVALVPPVRAAVVELLRIGGVVVREEAPPSPLPSTPSAGALRTPSEDATPVTLEEARRALGHDFGVPASLGPPTAVAMTHEGRVVELTWGSGAATTHLDVFAGSLDWGYLKRVWRAVTPTNVAGHEAVWLDSAHEIEWVDRSGATETAPPRLAGPTLVWLGTTPDGRGLTYRLEGPPSLRAALDIARTVP